MFGNMYVSYCLEINFVLICLPARALSQLTAWMELTAHSSHKSWKSRQEIQEMHAQHRADTSLPSCLPANNAAACCAPPARFFYPASAQARLGRISHDHSCSFVLYYYLSLSLLLLIAHLPLFHKF